MSARLDAATLDWFAEKYRGFAERADTLGTRTIYTTVANLASAESMEIRSMVTDDEKRRVIKDILTYRLLPEPVIEYLNNYLEAMEQERAS